MNTRLIFSPIKAANTGKINHYFITIYCLKLSYYCSMYCFFSANAVDVDNCTIEWSNVVGSKHNTKTRMHSSRMRTVRCSSRLLGGGVSGPGGCLPARGVCLSGGSACQGVSACHGVYACHGGVCQEGGLGLGCLPGGSLPRRVCGGCLANPPCEQNNRRLWKHYLSTTTLRTVIITHINLIYYSYRRNGT